MTAFSFSHPVLLRSIGTGTLVKNPFREQKFMKGIIQELMIVIAMENSNFGVVSMVV